MILALVATGLLVVLDELTGDSLLRGLLGGTSSGAVSASADTTMDNQDLGLSGRRFNICRGGTEMGFFEVCFHIF